MGLDTGVCTAAIAPVAGIIVDYLCRECAPYRWDEQGRWVVYEYAKANPTTLRWAYDGGLIGGPLEAGDVNCRYTASLEEETTLDRCAALGQRYSEPSAKILHLNPSLNGDCSNIKYNTPYCVKGCKFSDTLAFLHCCFGRFQTNNRASH